MLFCTLFGVLFEFCQAWALKELLFPLFQNSRFEFLISAQGLFLRKDFWKVDSYGLIHAMVNLI